MKKFFNDIADALNMLAGIESALNITDFSPNELVLGGWNGPRFHIGSPPNL